MQNRFTGSFWKLLVDSEMSKIVVIFPVKQVYCNTHKYVFIQANLNVQSESILGDEEKTAKRMDGSFFANVLYLHYF